MYVITDEGRKNFINLTPHTITLLDEHGNEIFDLGGVNPSPRVEEVKTGVKEVQVNGSSMFKIYTSKNVGVNGLPAPKEDTYYIVSRIVAEYAEDRDDLLVPDEFVRDSEGRIIGARAFKQIENETA